MSRRTLQLGASMLLVAALGSLLVTPRPLASLPWVLQVAAGATLVLWLSSSRGARVAQWLTPRRQVLAVLLAGGVVLVIVLTGTRWADYKLSYLSTVFASLPSWRSLPAPFFSTGISPNQAGATLAVFVAYAVAVALSPGPSRTSPRLRAAAGTFAIVGATVVFMTGSRASLAGIAAATILVLVLRDRRWLWLPGAAAGILVSVAVLDPGLIRELVNPLLREETLSTKVVARLDIWASALRGIQDHPFTGIGMGVLNDVLPIRYPYETVGLSYTVTHAHNVFLDFALTMGIPGVTGFVLFLIGVGNMIRRSFRVGESRTCKEAAGYALVATAGSLAAITVFLVFGLTDSLSVSTIFGILLWPWPILLVLISHSMCPEPN